MKLFQPIWTYVRFGLQSSRAAAPATRQRKLNFKLPRRDHLHRRPKRHRSRVRSQRRKFVKTSPVCTLYTHTPHLYTNSLSILSMCNPPETLCIQLGEIEMRPCDLVLVSCMVFPSAEWIMGILSMQFVYRLQPLTAHLNKTLHTPCTKVFSPKGGCSYIPHFTSWIASIRILLLLAAQKARRRRTCYKQSLSIEAHVFQTYTWDHCFDIQCWINNPMNAQLIEVVMGWVWSCGLLCRMMVWQLTNQWHHCKASWMMPWPWLRSSS